MNGTASPLPPEETLKSRLLQIEDWIFDLVDYKTGAPPAGATKNDIYNTMNIVLKEMRPRSWLF